MNPTHRYKIITGQFAGRVVDGFVIGIQDYPDQFKTENLTPDQVTALWQTNKEGFWYPEANVKIPFENRIQTVDQVVDYGNVQDLVIPFDKYNQEIFVGDTLYVASKNAVRLATVTKIAPKATMASYGILIRKITVKDVDDGQTLVINQSRDTIKITGIKNKT